MGFFVVCYESLRYHKHRAHTSLKGFDDVCLDFVWKAAERTCFVYSAYSSVNEDGNGFVIWSCKVVTYMFYMFFCLKGDCAHTNSCSD